MIVQIPSSEFSFLIEQVSSPMCALAKPLLGACFWGIFLLFGWAVLAAYFLLTSVQRLSDCFNVAFGFELSYDYNSFIHSFITFKIFPEHLLCARCFVGTGNHQ